MEDRTPGDSTPHSATVPECDWPSVAESLGLTVAHFRQLHAKEPGCSGIAVDVIRERGYRSLGTFDRHFLGERGYRSHQMLVPGIYIPCYAPGASEPTHDQFRPDTPANPKRKYESPQDRAKRLDVPPCCREALTDPSIPLWVVEAVKKVDAAASYGLCAVSVDSVWGWRGRNDHGGPTALADWELIPLKGPKGDDGKPVPRTVIIAYDSDTWRPERRHDLRPAAERLTGFLRSRGADVKWCVLPEGE